jgi:carboxylate-amine ligase
VEEEFLLVSAAGDAAVPLATRVLGVARELGLTTAPGAPVLCGELQEQQVESNSRPHSDLAALFGEIEDARRRADGAARAVGARLAALATSPVPTECVLAPSDRYARMAERFGISATDQLISGCHVHVAVQSDDEAVAVLDRIRVWLPVLLALSGNSPFWQGKDTRYASYRSQLWTSWPSSGPAEVFGSAEAYHRAVRLMLASGVIFDEKMIYFDARLSCHYPTVEIRAADVCLYAEDAVLVAGLARALVETAAREWRDGRPPADVPASMLRLCQWQAARDGLMGELLHPTLLDPRPAELVAVALLDHVRPVLREGGEEAYVERLLERVLRRGTGAQRQREVFSRTGDLGAVVLDAARVTVGEG